MNLIKLCFILLVFALLTMSCSGTSAFRFEKHVNDNSKWAAASESAKAFAPPSVN